MPEIHEDPAEVFIVFPAGGEAPSHPIGWGVPLESKMYEYSTKIFVVFFYSLIQPLY